MSRRPTTGVLIGGGYYAQFHAAAWKRIPEVQITAVADSIAGKARTFAESFGITSAYESVEEMLDREQPDFVDIITRPESHLMLTRLAAERGIDVICQKPMAPSWEDCLSMLDVCEKSGVRLLIHENWRWQPWYREAHRLINAGALGRIFQLSAQWRTSDGRGPEPYTLQPYFRKMPRLLVYETLVHLLDTFRYLGGEMTSVYCLNRRLNPFIAGEDQSIIVVTFASGIAGLIDANRISGPTPTQVAMNSMLIEGESAVLRLSHDGRLWITASGQAEREHMFFTTAEGYKGDSVRATQQHLIDCLHSGKPSESDGREYLKTVQAVFACYRSAEIGHVVQLD